MTDDIPYSSSIKDMPLMFCEMRRTALLLCEGKSGDEIVGLSMNKNIYQLDKPKRRRDVPLRMIKRLSAINKPLIKTIADGFDADARLVAFLALMKTDRLLFEYMREVYAYKHESGYNDISDTDFADFIYRKGEESETVVKWTTANLINIRGKIKSSLCEAGLAKRNGNTLIIQKPIIDGGLKRLFDEEDGVYLKAMLIEKENQ
jgi:hypothetical protein